MYVMDHITQNISNYNLFTHKLCGHIKEKKRKEKKNPQYPSIEEMKLE
jgi:hypothetical protein